MSSECLYKYDGGVVPTTDSYLFQSNVDHILLQIHKYTNALSIT